MRTLSLEDLIKILRDDKSALHSSYGVTRIGIFGSFAQGRQTISSDIDMVVEFEKDKKNIHNFLQLKRFMEKKLSRKIDLGFEQALKPAVRDKIKGKIIYV
jgi:predicted nucleotidyltransferase